MKLKLAAVGMDAALSINEINQILETTDYSLDLTDSIFSSNQITQLFSTLKKRKCPLTLNLTRCKTLSSDADELMLQELASTETSLLMLHLTESTIPFRGNLVEAILKKVSGIFLGGSAAASLNLKEIFSALNDNRILYKLEIVQDNDLTPEEVMLLTNVLKWHVTPLSLVLNVGSHQWRAFISKREDKDAFIKALKLEYGFQEELVLRSQTMFKKDVQREVNSKMFIVHPCHLEI